MIAARRSRRTALILPTFLVAALACQAADKPSPKARLDSSAGADGRAAEVPHDVVIARPSQPYMPGSVAAAGSITGSVTTASPLAPAAPKPTGKDSAICGSSIPDESVSQQGNGLGGVVVWLDGVRRGKQIPLERRLELESDHCRLTPRMQGAVVSSAVNVIGHDNFRQHLRFLAGGEKEARAAVLLGSDAQVIPTELPFKSPGLIVVKDADHPWPTAYVAVFDHPYFAVTAPNGTFTIDGVPAGKYTVRAWHERTKIAEQSIEVGAGGAAKVAMVLQAK